MSAFSQWIGREELARDILTAPAAKRWLATFDLSLPPEGPMPQGIHWCLCLPDTPTQRLGPDGHPRRDAETGSFLPPVAAPRRMWAGSDCEFLAPIETGAHIVRTSRIDTIEEKQGNSGLLTFVTLHHEISAQGNLAVRERQTLVYKEAPAAGSPPLPPPLSNETFDGRGWSRMEHIVPGMPLLFRYSALTFNTHRIHYDADYARILEGYRGAVVHGPLMATLLLRLAAQHIGENRLRRFSFRGISPAIADEELILALREDGAASLELALFARDGRQVMKAQAGF